MVTVDIPGCGWSVSSRALPYVDCESDLRRFVGSTDGSIEFEEEADAAWCAACFPSLSAADACAAVLHGAHLLRTAFYYLPLGYCQATRHLAACLTIVAHESDDLQTCYDNTYSQQVSPLLMSTQVTSTS